MGWISRQSKGCQRLSTFCQNWDISKSREIDTLADAAAPETLAEAALHLGCRSVAYTYNDPTIFLEYAIDVAKACHAVGVKSVAVTAGYMAPEAREEFYTYIDAANVDLKAFTEDFYHKLCTGELARVLDTLIYLRNKTDVWFEVTTLLIPGENDSPEEIDNMTQWFLDNLGTDVPLHFTAFHPDYRMRNKPRTPHEALLRARDIALRNGLHHVYVGNVHDEACSSTYCPCCGDMVIGRDWYRLTRWNLDDKGRCRSCSMAISGVYDGPPGGWGRKRKPVRLIEYDQRRRSGSMTDTTARPYRAIARADGCTRSQGTDTAEPGAFVQFDRGIVRGVADDRCHLAVGGVRPVLGQTIKQSGPDAPLRVGGRRSRGLV